SAVSICSGVCPAALPTTKTAPKAPAAHPASRMRIPLQLDNPQRLARQGGQSLDMNHARAINAAVEAHSAPSWTVDFQEKTATPAHLSWWRATPVRRAGQGPVLGPHLLRVADTSMTHPYNLCVGSRPAA